MTRKWIAVLLIGVIGFVQAGPAFAQGETPPSKQPEPSTPPSAQPTHTQATAPPESTKVNLSECIERGRTDGRHVGTGGSFLGGFAGGLFLGLIGTGIAYAVQSEPDPPATLKYEIGDAQCRLAYGDAYGEQGKKKKRGAAITGGLLGTALLVVIVVSASSGQ